MIQSAQPYLNFPGNTEEAFEFYRSVFGGEISEMLRFRDMPDTMGVAEEYLGKIAHIALPLGKAGHLMANDVFGGWAEGFVVGTNTCTHLEVESAEEAESLFENLVQGGKTDMPMTRTDWAERFGILVDRYGIRWMVSFTGAAGG